MRKNPRRHGGSAAWASKCQPRNGYRRCENHGAIRLFTDHRCGGDHAQLVITGKTLSGIPPLDQLRLVRKLYELVGRASRLDLAFDDLEGRVPVSRVAAAWSSGEVVCHWRSISERANRPRGGGYLSHSVTLGSGHSDSRLCVYRKGLESKSEDYPSWVRWELRLRDEAADEAIRELLEVCRVERLADLPENKPAAWREHKDPVLCEGLNGYPVHRSEFDHDHEALRAVKRRGVDILRRRVDFRDRSTGGGNVTRASRVEWWEEFLEHFDPDPEEFQRLEAEVERANEEWRLNGMRLDDSYERLELAEAAVQERKIRLRVNAEKAPNEAFGQAFEEYRAEHPEFELCPLSFRLSGRDACEDVGPAQESKVEQPAFAVIEGSGHGPPLDSAFRGRPEYLRLVASREESSFRARSAGALPPEMQAANTCSHGRAGMRRIVGEVSAACSRFGRRLLSSCSSGLSRLLTPAGWRQRPDSTRAIADPSTGAAPAVRASPPRTRLLGRHLGAESLGSASESPEGQMAHALPGVGSKHGHGTYLTLGRETNQ